MRIGRVNEMEITVTRSPSLQGATLGRLQCAELNLFTLEDEVREPGGSDCAITQQWVASWKIQNVTAIPRGRFEVIITFSPHFGCDLPLLLNVPGFTAVRIHWGNKAADTDGCILVGSSAEGNLIYKSRAAFDLLFPRVKAAIAAGDKVFITVA